MKKMRCHYDVLGIPKDADDSQIKSAYKKLALKWHPDKNLENAEEAKEQFQLVQQSYEVLSDRQERAWYDNHREQILRGSNSEFKDNSLDVFQYFTTTCFKGYGDDPNGFYIVYRNVFEKIAKEDLEFMENKDEFCQIPSFGNSKSDYDEVVGPFYAYWTSYSTKKSYVWLDPYNLNDIRDRKIFKIAEKKNKKIRQQAKKERNDEIRNLVAFVRKRDKRVQEHAKKIEAKILENRQKYEQISKRKRLERKILHNNDTQAEWTKFDNVKSELEEIERRLAEQFGEQLSDSEESQEDNEVENNLYCVACNKIFKTTKALQNHEASKKHKENLQILQETMLDEGNDISESSEEQEKNVSETLEKNVQHEDINEDNRNDYPVYDKEDIDIASDNSLSSTETKRKKKKKKTRKTVAKSILVESDGNGDDLLSKTDEIGKFSNDDSEFSSISKVKKQKKKTKKSSQFENNRNALATEDNDNVIKEALEEPFKETTRRSNKKSNKKKDTKNEKEANSNIDIDVNHCCATCKSNFPSKNKLFEHLKTTGHSIYLSKEQKKNKQKKNINNALS